MHLRLPHTPSPGSNACRTFPARHLSIFKTLAEGQCGCEESPVCHDAFVQPSHASWVTAWERSKSWSSWTRLHRAHAALFFRRSPSLPCSWLPLSHSLSLSFCTSGSKRSGRHVQCSRMRCAELWPGTCRSPMRSPTQPCPFCEVPRYKSTPSTLQDMKL